MDEQIRTSELDTQPSQIDVRRIGQQLPNDDPLGVPGECRRHPLVCGQYFYTLPSHVLAAVVNEIGEDRFDEELLTLERTLSAICSDHSQTAGFRNCVRIPYFELRPTVVPSVPAEWARQAGLNPAGVDLALNVYRERDVAAFDRFSRGYCGWLLTNRQFLDEQDELLLAHAATVRRWGTEHVAASLPASYRAEMIPGTDPNDDSSWTNFTEQLQSFLVRWRLQGLAGPYLPVPCKPLMGGIVVRGDVQHLTSTGGVFYLPETMPIPSRDQLRGMLDDALHSGERPEHLEEWLNIVRAGNTARNKMDPFARVFELQHYWRLLHRRHAVAIYRKTGRLEEVFAILFNVNPARIKGDLAGIRRRLGRDWLSRRWPR